LPPFGQEKTTWIPAFAGMTGFYAAYLFDAAGQASVGWESRAAAHPDGGIFQREAPGWWRRFPSRGREFCLAFTGMTGCCYSRGKRNIAMSIHLRPAAVAGNFYPGSPGRLNRVVAAMLADVKGTPEDCPKALIVPHAGYIYSGPIAASAFATLASRKNVIHRVVLLGPTHRIAVRGLALPDCDAFATPLGNVPVDPAAADAIRDLPQVVVSDPAHRLEHSLEVEIPFLQTILGEFSLLPIAVGDASPPAVAEVLDRLWGGPETLIVVSSDLSHYLSYEEALRIDAATACQIDKLNPTIHHEQACGATPVNGLLLAAREHGLQVRRLDLRNSGDTAGDRQRVVGYGAFAFFEPQQGEHHHVH
jgi:AmmeMemoRadiSam system protein B